MSKEVAKKEESAVSTEVMDLMFGQEGNENLTQEDVATPFLRLLQKMSPEVEEGSESYVEGARPGAFFNTGNGKVYEPGELLFIPVYCQSVWIEWKPRDMGGGFVRQYAQGERPPNSERQIMVEIPETGHEVMLTHNHFGFAIDSDGVADEVVFSCKGTMLTPSKKLNAALMSAKSVDSEGRSRPLRRFANVVTLGSKRRENEQGSWYVFTFSDRRMLDPSDPVEMQWLVGAKALYDMASAGELKIAEESMGASQEAADTEIPF